MPRIAPVIHTLIATRHKHLRFARTSALVFCHHNQKRPTGKRRKTLAAKRMPLHHLDGMRKPTRLATEDIENNMRALPGGFWCRKRMMSLGLATIDKPHRGWSWFDDIAERRECL